MEKLLFKLLVCYSILVVFVNSYSDDDAWNDYKVAIDYLLAEKC